MNKDRYEYWLKIATIVVDAYTKLNDACTKAEKAGCLDLEGSLHSAIWTSFEDLLKCVDTVGVGKFKTGWITWYLYEAPSWSTKTVEVEHGHKKTTYDVNTIEGLAELITDCEEQEHEQKENQ